MSCTNKYPAAKGAEGGFMQPGNNSWPVTYSDRHPVSRKVFKFKFWKVPMAGWPQLGELLPKQDLGISANSHNKT